jgi:hypothetical protein
MYNLLLTVIFLFSGDVFASKIHIKEVIEETALRSGFKRNLVLALSGRKMDEISTHMLHNQIRDQFKLCMPTRSKFDGRSQSLTKDHLLEAVNLQFHLIMAHYAYLKLHGPVVGYDYKTAILPEINERINHYTFKYECSY